MKLRILLGVALVFGLVACGTDQTGQTDDPDPTVDSMATPTTSPTPETSTTTVAGDETAAAVAAFEEWVDNIASGDQQAVWEGLAPASQEAIGEDTFFESTVFELSEGWGAWSAVDDVDFRLTEEGDETLLWVSGTVSQEGTTEEREMSIPVVRTDGGWLMSPFEGLGG